MAGFLRKIFSFVRTIAGGLQTISAITSVLLGKRLEKIEEIPTRRESPFLNRYLDAPLRTPIDTAAKKAVAVAAVIAKKRGVPAIAAKTSMELASTVDEGLTRMKVAYQQGKGKLNSTKAAEEIIDRTAARVVSFTDKVIEVGVPIMAKTVVKAVTRVFPPAKIVAPVVRVAVPFVTDVTKKVVRKGVEFMAKTAKTIVKGVVSGVKKVAKMFKSILS